MLITARLTNIITGQVVKAAGFQYQAPPNRLGASIMVALSNPLDGGLPIGDALKFEVGLGQMAIPPNWSWVTLLDEGRIAGRAAHTSFVRPKKTGKGSPGDTLQVSALNTLADRWTLAPRRPVIMFDPAQINPQSLQISPQDCPIDLMSGQPILPVIESIGGLNLYQILSRAYTSNLPFLRPSPSWADTLEVGAGCGFSQFVTNLPNFPVDRADFTLQSGWHGGASAAYSFFNPIFYEDNNILYIWDIDRGLPFGYVPHTLALKCQITYDEDTPPEEITNAILVSYQIPMPIQNEIFFPGGIPNAIPGYRFDHDKPLEGGTPNQPGYYRQEVTRKILEYKDLTTGEVVFSAEVEVETINYAYRLNLAREVVISRQVMQIYYQGKLKTGHDMTLEATYPNPEVEGNPDKFEEVLTETCVIEWTADINNPGDSLLLYSKTETEGSVLVEEETNPPEGKDAKKTYTPIMDAARSNNIILDLDKQEEAGVRQYINRRPIKATIERLKVTGLNQAQIETTQVDLISGTAFPPTTISRAGSISTAGGRRGLSRTRAQNVRTELIVDADSIAKYGFRRAEELGVGRLPIGEARALCVRRLYRKAHPRRSVTIELPGIDLGIRRGSVVKAYNRSGGYIIALITGFTITGKSLGVPGQQMINMVMEGIEV
jgi:hypothetical protein